MNIQGWFPLGLTSLISLLSKGLSSTIVLQHHSSNTSVLWHSAFFTVHFSHLYMTTGKNHSFYYKDLSFSFFSHLFIHLTYSCLLTHSDGDNDNGCINQGKTRKRELMPDSVLERICWVGQKYLFGFSVTSYENPKQNFWATQQHWKLVTKVIKDMKNLVIIRYPELS